MTKRGQATETTLAPAVAAAVQATKETNAEQLVREGLGPVTRKFAEAGIRKSSWQVIRYAVSGDLEAVKVGSTWQTSAAAVLRWLEKSTNKALRIRTGAAQAASPERDRQRAAAKRYLDNARRGKAAAAR